MRAPQVRLVCKAGERVKAKLRLTQSEQYFENERLDYLRPHPETALPILKQPVR